MTSLYRSVGCKGHSGVGSLFLTRKTLAYHVDKNDGHHPVVEVQWSQVNKVTANAASKKASPMLKVTFVAPVPEPESDSYSVDLDHNLNAKETTQSSVVFKFKTRESLEEAKVDMRSRLAEYDPQQRQLAAHSEAESVGQDSSFTLSSCETNDCDSFYGGRSAHTTLSEGVQHAPPPPPGAPDPPATHSSKNHKARSSERFVPPPKSLREARETRLTKSGTSGPTQTVPAPREKPRRARSSQNRNPRGKTNSSKPRSKMERMSSFSSHTGTLTTAATSECHSMSTHATSTGPMLQVLPDNRIMLRQRNAQAPGNYVDNLILDFSSLQQEQVATAAPVLPMSQLLARSRSQRSLSPMPRRSSQLPPHPPMPTRQYPLTPNMGSANAPHHPGNHSLAAASYHGNNNHPNNSLASASYHGSNLHLESTSYHHPHSYVADNRAGQPRRVSFDSMPMHAPPPQYLQEDHIDMGGHCSGMRPHSEWSASDHHPRRGRAPPRRQPSSRRNDRSPPRRVSFRDYYHDEEDNRRREDSLSDDDDDDDSSCSRQDRRKGKKLQDKKRRKDRGHSSKRDDDSSCSSSSSDDRSSRRKEKKKTRDDEETGTKSKTNQKRWDRWLPKLRL